MTDDAWFADRTDGAPIALRRRAQHYFTASAPGELSSRLANAGHAALVAAMSDGAGRAAALDLLAADALITLALLAASERDPGALARDAAALCALAAA